MPKNRNFLPFKPIIAPEQLIQYCHCFGFTNKRYINSDYKLFLSMLVDTSNEIYGCSSLPIDFLKNTTIESYETIIFANTSFSQRTTNLPNYSSNQKLSQAGFDALQISHDKVKNIKLSKEKSLNNTFEIII